MRSGSAEIPSPKDGHTGGLGCQYLGVRGRCRLLTFGREIDMASVVEHLVRASADKVWLDARSHGEVESESPRVAATEAGLYGFPDAHIAKAVLRASP